jgi:hypothetical protein
MDLFHNPFNACNARFVGLESYMGIQRCREARETRLACGVADFIHELADKHIDLAGVSARCEIH